MVDPSKVLAEALDLPVRERLRIAGALLRSVDPEEDEDAAAAWVTELDRRSAIGIGRERNLATDRCCCRPRTRA
jgi:hypothetical protein